MERERNKMEHTKTTDLIIDGRKNGNEKKKTRERKCLYNSREREGIERKGKERKGRKRRNGKM